MPSTCHSVQWTSPKVWVGAECKGPGFRRAQLLGSGHWLSLSRGDDTFSYSDCGWCLLIIWIRQRFLQGFSSPCGFFSFLLFRLLSLNHFVFSFTSGFCGIFSLSSATSVLLRCSLLLESQVYGVEFTMVPWVNWILLLLLWSLPFTLNVLCLKMMSPSVFWSPLVFRVSNL